MPPPCLLALKNEKQKLNNIQRKPFPPTLVPPISSLPADDGPENKTLCPPKLRSQDDGVVVRRKNPRENQKHPSTFEFLLHPLASKPYSRVRPCFVDICLPTVDIMGISEQPEKHGGHHGGELIPTLFIDMREDPDCRTTPKKRPYRTLDGCCFFGLLLLLLMLLMMMLWLLCVCVGRQVGW